MRKYYFLALLPLPLFSIAQSNYKSGYAVSAKGDTLRGYIDLKQWGHNPKNISFKRSLSDKAQLLGLSDINYFEISGYTSYHQYNVPISLNPIDISSPSSFADTSTTTGDVFLKILQSGKNVALYSYTDAVKERFYVKDNSMPIPIELIYGIYQDPKSDKVINKNTYQVQLGQLVIKYNPADDKLITQVQAAEYREGDILPIVAKINGNTGVQTASKSGGHSSVGFCAGAGLISNTVKDGQYYGSPSSSSSGPKVAIGADLIVNQPTGSLILRVELAWSANNYTFNDIDDPLFNSANPRHSTIKVKQNVIAATPQAMYNIYNTEGLKVFVDLGYSLNLVSYPLNQVTTTGGTGSTVGNKLDSKGSYSTFQFKAGVVIAKRFEIYGAYFPSADLSDSFTYTNNITSYQFGLNYHFGNRYR